ncbi:Cna B-type domain-containing protein, partial [Vagococcus sp.]|uniref:Cna B-type domain-containing protein n=1 Tax=Vagococcus sp. TaxID=1933889 RepID=UPI003F99060E
MSDKQVAEGILGWNITINQERAMLDRWQIVDHVENGEIIANSIWVQDVQGKNILTEKELLADKDYELTYEMSGDKRVGFTLKYNKKTDHHFQIAYDTKVTDSQKNKAIYTYEINKVPGEDEDEASYEPKPDPENWVSLTKSGSFIDSLYSNIDPPEFPAGAKGVSWKILINIGRKKVGTGAKLTDKIPEGQKYVPGSARLEKERWEAGPFEELPAQNVVYNEATNELEVTVPAGVSYMMRLRFDTIFEDQSVFPTGEVKNTAYYEDVNTDRTAVVGSLMTGWQDNALVEKTGGVKTGTKNTMAWNVEVNPLSYHLKNVEVFDKNWVNQRVLPETVQVKKKTGERLQENIDYVFDYTERQFYIKFLNDVREPIDISYDAQIVYPSGSRPGQQIPVKNGITVKGDNFKMESNEVTVTEQVVYPDSSGIIHGKTKELHLIKKDKSNNKPLAGAEFTLYRGKVKDKTKIVDRLVSNQQGEVFFDKLTKDDYLLVETKAPSGYAISQELADGKLYKISDDVPEVQTYDLMNEKTSDERIELKAEKIWKGTPVTKETPDITVYLRANGTVVQEKKLTKANDYKVTFTDLKKQDEKGQLIQYDMFEEDIPHYNGEATQTESGWLFTNTYTEELNIKGDKIWKDYDNAFNTRPDEITLHLYKNGQKEATQVVTPDKNGRWAYEFTNLEKYDSQGKENKYTVVEEKVPGYVGTQNGYDFTNEYTNDETIEIPVMKIWKDYQNTHDTRPNQLKFVLYQDNTKFQELTLSQEDASETNESVWEGKFTDLPKYRNDGGEFEYLVKEEFSDSRYQSEKSAEGNTFTNTYVNNDKVSVSGEKEWINDQNNKLNTRPESITVNLYRNTQGATDMDTFVASQVVKPDASGNWHYQFKDLDKYDEQGRSYVYKVKEDKVPGYESEFEGSTLKNTYQNTEKTAVFGEKIWQDNNDKLGARPTKIKVHLLQNGQKYQEKEIEADASGDWRYSFTDLPKYDEHLDPYLYTIEEDPIEDYTSETQGYNLINHYQNTETTKISIEKIWMNEIVGTDIRPEKVQFFLLQNNGLYREDPYEITPDANGEWKTTLTDLPKYDNNGEAYQYDIQEVTVPDYDSTVEVVPLGDPNTLGFKLTNTKDHSLDTTDLSGVKYWDDHENVFGKRPTQAVFKEKLELYRKTEGTTGIGEQMTEAVPMITDGDTASEWRYTYTDLAKYEAVTNKLYIYTVKELPIDEYTSTQIGDSFINEYRNTEKVKLAVKKEWDDYNNKFNTRPDEIEIQLTQDERPYGDVRTLQPDADGQWQTEFIDLPKYDDEGVLYRYNIIEVSDLQDYESVLKKETDTSTDDLIVLKLTNTFRQTEKTAINGEKIWDDYDNKFGTRPDFIQVILLINGMESDHKKIVFPDSETQLWTYEFTDLPKYDGNGDEYRYSVKEVVVQDYTTQIPDATQIINTYRKTDVVQFSGRKIWEDYENKFETRPTEIKFNLFQNGELIDTTVATGSSSGTQDWTYDFNQSYPKYDEDGNLYDYQVLEEVVQDYETTEVNSTDFKNNYINNETIDLKGQKIWQDFFENQTHSVISFDLYQIAADGTQTQLKTTQASEDTQWRYEFTDLPKYDELGEEIQYLVKEQEVEHYTSTTVGSDFINHYETTEVSGQKVWQDTGFESERPLSITVGVFIAGTETLIKSQEVVEDWNFTFTDLPKYNPENQLIQYEVREINPSAKYESSVSGMTITNVYQTVDKSGEKHWENDDDGESRPETITVDLYQNDTKYASQEVASGSDGRWTYEFTDLPKIDEEGNEYVYTVKEKEIPTNYEVSYDGMKITNSYQTTEVSGKKIWQDTGHVNKRPQAITVVLYQDGAEYARQEVKAGPNEDWSYTFTDLPEYSEGTTTRYTYTVKEADVPKDYESSVSGTTITNTYQTVDKSGEKHWENDGKGEPRPETITVDLYQNDTKYASQEVASGSDGRWTYEFTNLPKVDKTGQEYVYTVKENKVPTNYEVSYDGLKITNTYQTTEVSGEKVWQDKGHEKERPEHITVVLYQDGTEYARQEVKAGSEGKWSYEFKDLPEYSEGTTTRYTYTVK